MNADHKLGRSEAIRDASRLIYEQLSALEDSIQDRTSELCTDPHHEGYVQDDVKLSELRAMRTALDFINGKVVEL